MTKVQQQERRQQWEMRIAEYRSSGLSVREWCASNGVNPERLWYWLRRFKDEKNKSESTTWLPVDLSGARAKGQPEGSGLVVMVGKAGIEVKAGFEPDLLCALVRVLLAVC